MRGMYILNRGKGKPSSFFYGRTVSGVELIQGKTRTIIPTNAWQAILQAVTGLGISSSTGAANAKDLGKIITGVEIGSPWNPSLIAGVITILEHEGSIESYFGLIGKSNAAGRFFRS